MSKDFVPVLAAAGQLDVSFPAAERAAAVSCAEAAIGSEEDFSVLSAARLSAGGVADHMVTQMLRQGDAEVFKLYSQAKLRMMREELAKLDRQATERF